MGVLCGSKSLRGLSAAVIMAAPLIADSAAQAATVSIDGQQRAWDLIIQFSDRLD